ncbi:MAG: hypothetical protein DBP03_18460 [gamma proteobacterium symbiont of Ctena orbiculata]|nr:MAG: hypothetical protein DBP03_18460 [gamma proteobacterium symbiont of Ctena orbiculata]
MNIKQSRVHADCHSSGDEKGDYPKIILWITPSPKEERGRLYIYSKMFCPLMFRQVSLEVPMTTVVFSLLTEAR